MKLYEVPRNTRIRLENGTELHFGHIDGMYSYCKTDNNKIVHLYAGADVELVKRKDDKEPT